MRKLIAIIFKDTLVRFTSPVEWLFFLILPVVLVYRIMNEEEVLLRELPGYREYTRKVKYRLIPGIW